MYSLFLICDILVYLWIFDELHSTVHRSSNYKLHSMISLRGQILKDKNT